MIANKTVAISTLIIYVDFLQNLIGSAFIIPTINPKIATTIGITHDAFYLGMNKNSDGVKYDTMITNKAYLLLNPNFTSLQPPSSTSNLYSCLFQDELPKTKLRERQLH